ncbi:MAG: GNAT family N-acetyltransferase [Ilumatobacter sp.]|nr:GNAT family N-acetyltransferase [Ilumatobacter sp.]
MRANVWKIYLTLAVAVAATYFLVETTSLSKLVLYNGIGLSAVIAVLFGIWRNQPTNKKAWYLIAGSLASFLTADIVYYVLEIIHNEPPFPSIADAFYLGMYPVMILGMLSLLRTVSPGRDMAGLIDATLVAVATFAVLGILVMDTYITDADVTLLERLISIAYPVMDVALVAVAARLMAAVHLKQRTFVFMTIALLSLLVADTLYGVLGIAGTFTTGGPADAFWLGFYVLIATGALHPSMGDNLAARDSNLATITKPRLGLLFLVVTAVPLIDLLWGEPFDKLLTTVASMIMFSLVLVRLMGLMSVVQHKEKQARHDARHDALTGLANRVLFGERVESFVNQRKDGVVSVLFVDLDDFKFINDSLGHHVGDELLVAVAARLEDCVRTNDVVARLSGDEFAVLLESAVDRQDAVAVAQRVQDSLEDPVIIDDREIMISASVGIAVERRSNIERAETILRAADVAMYRAKSKGKGRFEFFEQGMHLEAIERLDLKTDLQVALERGQFELNYQPIVDMNTEKVRSVEALIRWNHPTRGYVLPDRFINLAEQTGQIVPIGRWVLREACNQVMRWRKEHPDTAPKGVAVNLSVRQLHDPKLLEDVADALSVSGLEPQALTLEITESMLIEETDRGSRALDQLKAMKVKIAIDDFGTGYSSLSYLRRFPVDTIKIDKSFVAEMETSPTSVALVRAVIDLAHSLEVATVAEGIETEDQKLQLSGLNCTYGQGYYFSRPMSAGAIDEKLVTAAKNAKARRHAPLDVEILDGLESTRDVVPQLGSLHSELGVPVMARTRWMETWASVYEEWEPMTVLVRERTTGRVEAAALLAHKEDGFGGHDIVAMGHGTIACTRFPSRSERASKLLTKGIKDRLSQFGKWTLHFQQLPEGDPVTKLLAQQLSNAEMTPDLWVPQVIFDDDSSLNDFLSRNMRRQIKKAWNRLATDGHRVEMKIARSEFEIMEVLPRIEEIHVERDHDTGRESDLDDPKVNELWKRLVLAHGASGQIEISTMLIDGEIAGFVIGIIDDDAYRVFDGHFNSEFHRYSPGRIIESAVLERAAVDARFRELDWMAGVAAEKILTSNHNEGRMQLVASSKANAKPAPKPIPDHAPNGADGKKEHAEVPVDTTRNGPKPKAAKKNSSVLLGDA